MTIQEAQTLFNKTGLRYQISDWKTPRNGCKYHIQVGFEDGRGGKWYTLAKGVGKSFDEAFIAAMVLFKERYDSYAANPSS